MDLCLDLNQRDGIWIDGTHRVFEKSEFEGMNFGIKIKPLTRTELRKIRRESNTLKGFDSDIAFPKIFMNQVLDWKLKDSAGQDIPFTDENKKVICEQFTTLTNLVAAACLDANVQTIDEDEIKNLSTSGNGD